MQPHPRDRFITVFGRKPVLEAIAAARAGRAEIDKIVVDEKARGDAVDRIVREAADLGAQVQRASAADVTRISRNARQDQGVVADVRAPNMQSLDAALASDSLQGPLLLIDGVTTPANVGMIIRTATAAGLGGVVIPRRGSPEIGPLVVKASAGVAFHACLLRTPTVAAALDGLQGVGYRPVVLAGDAPNAVPLWDAKLTRRDLFVLGAETHGVSPEARAAAELALAIPMAAGVDSLNVAAAAAVLSFELSRRGLTG